MPNQGARLDPSTGQYVRARARNPVLFDHFVGDTLHGDDWATADEGTGTQFAISTAAGAGGFVRGTTATTSGNNEEMAGELIWKANKGGLYVEWGIQLPSIANIAVVCGLSDAKSETGIAVSLSGSTFTTTATDGAFWVFDTAATTAVFYGIGVANDVDTASVTGVAPVAATTMTLGIAIGAGGDATWYQDDTAVGSKAAAVTATVALCPYIAVATRTTAAKSLDVDWVYVTQDV